jgi:hypothetical protein
MNKNRTPISDEVKIARLKAQLAKLEVQKEEPIEVPQQELEIKKVSMDDLVPVMSLLPYPLNLSTKEGGQGNTRKFTRFGEVKQIVYSDLIEIIEVHSNFLQAGFFYILNPSVIRIHGLDDVYSKILTKEKLEALLSASSDECLTLYTAANPVQQETIVQLLVDKVRDNPDSVNLNVIDKLSRLAKVNIFERAEAGRMPEAEA